MSPLIDADQVRNLNSAEGSGYWSVHTHSKFSVQDALPTPTAIVEKAAELGYPGCALTDHGNMAGAIEFYRACKKHNIKPFIGTEMYFCPDRNADKTGKRWHLGLVAYTEQGYRNMIQINTYAHTNFKWKPTIDFEDMALFHERGWTEGIALTTGCYFGYVIQTLITKGYQAARSVVATFSSWFLTYVEVQRHCIDQEPCTEEEIAEALVEIAEDLGLHVVITQDSHYIEHSQQQTHDLLKALVSFSKDGDDAVFPGDGFHMADEQWMRDHHDERTFALGMAGLSDLLSRNTLVIPEADEYRYRIPSLYDDPQRMLSELVYAEAIKLDLDDDYLARLDEELDVVCAAQMEQYLLLVNDVCSWMRNNGVNYQTRGSAGGSLICYLLGITNFDPLRWGARFDRFLSKDRTKPPDIDLDIDSRRRPEVLAWLSERYAVAQLGTWAALSMEPDKEAIYLEEDPTAQKGILLRRYYAKRRSALIERGMPRESINAQLEWDAIPEDERKRLRLLNEAQAFAQYGTHTCGLALLNSRTELSRLVPMMRARGDDEDGTPRLVTQYDGDVIESIGIVKLDVLGLRTMAVLAQTVENLGWSLADLHSIESIPLDDAASFDMIARGDTGGVFQLEGWTAQRGVRDLRPKHIDDVIAAMALFRPGVMKSGATKSFIRRRNGSERVPERHQIIATATERTQGILLYQDQVIAILRDLGLDPDDLTRFLKAIKASNKKVAEAQSTMEHYLPIIKRMCHERGMSDADWNWLQEAFAAFAEYAFNIAHATVYGLTAYRCAWLARNRPVEFHAALLAMSAGTDKEALYIKVARSRGVRVLSPDINQSQITHAVGYSGQVKVVRKGFLSLKGLGLSAALPLVESQPYADIEDFFDRVNKTKVTGCKDWKNGISNADDLKGVLAVLEEHDVLKSIGGLTYGIGNAAWKEQRKQQRAEQAARKRAEREQKKEKAA